MTNEFHALGSLPTRTGVAGGARSHAFREIDASSSRRPGLVVLLLFALILAMAASAGTAQATTGHRYVSQFGSAGSSGGAFSVPAGVAEDQATGDLYVADQANNRVEKFSAAGEFIVAFNGSATPAGSFSGPTGVAVDPTSGDVYVTDQANNAVDRFSSTGAYISQLDATATPGGGFSSPSGIAVDPSNGNVYITDSGDAVVNVFSSKGSYLTQFGAGVLIFPTSVAVDGSSNVYVADPGSATVEKYPALGAGEPSVIDATGAQTVAVNSGSGEVYVGENGPVGFQVSDFNSGGASRIYTFGAGHIGSSAGIAVDASSNVVYVADAANNDVLRFVPFIAPTVTTGASTAVTVSGATLAGTVNPEGAATSFHFEYGPETSYGSSSPETEAGAGSSDVPASTEVEGLEPNTTYHYRLTASNSLGSNAGEDATFKTSAAAPVVDGQPPFATTITATTATLHATINPRNSPTTYHFNYGTSIAYGTSAPTPNGEGGSAGEEAVTTTITGLAPSTTYHFQVVADNGTAGPVAGQDQTFTTLPPLPTASTGTPGAITAISALLSGSANTHGLTGTYRFLITGTDTPGGGATSPQPLTAINGEVPVSATITGLSPGMHYSYRVAVTTAGGTVYGAAQPLATSPAPPYEGPAAHGTPGPLSSGLPTPIDQFGAYIAPANPPAATTPKPTTHPKPKPKHKHHKKKKKKKKRKPTAKKANTNQKGHR